MLKYLKIMEDKLIVVFSTPNIIKETNSANYKGYVNKKLK